LKGGSISTQAIWGPHGVPVAEGEGEAFSGLGSERVLSWSPNLWSSVCNASVCVRTSAFSSFLLGSGRNNTATPPIINPNRKATSVLISHSFAIGHRAGCFSALTPLPWSKPQSGQLARFLYSLSTSGYRPRCTPGMTRKYCPSLDRKRSHGPSALILPA